MWINVNAAFDISLFALILGHRGGRAPRAPNLPTLAQPCT